MKSKKTNDPFETRSWALDVIADPYQVMAGCFNFTEIGTFRNLIRQVLFSAVSLKVHRKSEPSEVLLQFKVINSVMLAASELCQLKRKEGLKISFDQFMEQRLYAKPFSACPEWDYMPRALSLAEYKNPYLAFKRFFKFQQLEKWRQDVEEILDCALGSYKNDCELNLLKIYFHLMKLMEAAHLVDVREVTHVNGYLKPGLVLQRQP